MIHVCFGLHDKTGRYSKFTGTTLTSIFENTNSEVTAHILHDDTLTDDNRERFSKLAERYNQRVEFHNVEKLCPDEINNIVNLRPVIKKAWFSVAAIYRLLIPQLISADVEKIIYLDSDIIVNLDINELWQIELGEKILGVIPESLNGINTAERFNLCRDGLIKAEDYFNSGVLLINVKLFRDMQSHLMDGIKFIAAHDQYISFDQDILNYCFAARALKLPAKFNRFLETANVNGEGVVERNIYHYSGGSMGFETNEPLKQLWMDYFLKSGWLDAAAMGRLYEKFQQKDSEIKNLLISLMAAMNGRRRAFVTFAKYIEILKFLFAARDDELLVIENFRDVPHLIDTLKKSRQQKVFISLIENYPLLRDWLTAEGFVENKDFFDGKKFLAESHVWQISSYDFIAAL